MADNYLEKKYEEFKNSKKVVVKRTNPSLDTLLIKNRSTRGYLKEHVVRVDELEKIVRVNTQIASGRNQQVLRFRLVTKGVEAEKVAGCVRMGSALKDITLPLPGTEPEAFIVACLQKGKEEDRIVDVDLGISLQSMLLKAVEIGLNGLVIMAFNKEKLKDALMLENEPLAVLAIGKGIEKFQLLQISEGDDHTYYRKEGIHYIPKVKLEDLLIH